MRLLSRQRLEAPAPSKEAYLIQLVARWRAQEERVAMLDRDLKDQHAILREITELEIPDALDDADLEKLKLPDGSTLSAPVEFIPQYLVRDESKVYEWLRGNGFGEKLKRSVTVDFQMGEDVWANKFILFLKKNLPDKWKDRTYIHSGTEKVVGRAITERGLTPPPELSIFPLRRAKIVAARTRMQDGS